ncbi:MAG TPA: phenylalanine--tRNA ligase subunit beta [Lutibacter sp.]|nr:phenylalanine--tRNA ligase subunit beta [Lutibacter sp.]
MKIAYNWLKQFINIDWEAEKAGNLLTDLGLEIEGIENFESIKGSLKGLVVGEVLTCEKHPNADKLSLTTVDLGDGKATQIVCGAPNVAVGQKVPVATIGTILYDEKGKSFPIKKGKIRGEDSFGMICAEDELGLGTSHDGIMILDDSLKNGEKLASVFNIESDQVFEIGLTPNRADAMSHYGVARDLKAGLQQQGVSLKLVSPSVMDFHVTTRTRKITIDVADKNLIPRYAGVTITDIEIKDSPKWLQNRLKSIGLTPKNNIIDVTNYVMHELGQPLHAFDANKIKGDKIIVKTLEKGTKFITLDAVERTLHEEDIMICDADSNPLCIGGVFGGLNSGVTEHTTSIFLESAYFNPVSIRKTAKRHALNTDASFRFERGIDVNFVKYALKRASLLILEIAGGNISSDIQDYYPERFKDFEVVVSYNNINRLIGQKIDKETIKNILASLDIKINSETEEILGLTIPSYRVDVQREADVIEEILRVYGYNNIEFSQKLNTSISFTEFDKQKYENNLANQLVSQGYFETMANSLTKPVYTELSDKLNDDVSVMMLNPLSSDLEAMRQSMLFGGLESIAYNNNRQQNNLRFFEFGKTYHKYQDKYEEEKHLALYVTGNQSQNHWQVTDQKADFFYLKASVIALLQKSGIVNYKTKPTKNDIFSEGIALSDGKVKVAELGVIKRTILKSFGIKQEVLFADIDIERLFEKSKNHLIKVQASPKFPSVKRDLALLLDTEVTYNELYQVAFQTERKLLKEVNLFDVYEGKNLAKGKKSYALSFVLRDENKTLNDKMIDKVMQKLVQTYTKQFGAELRG